MDSQGGLQNLPIMQIPFSFNSCQSPTCRYSIKTILPSFALYQGGIWEEKKVFSFSILIKVWYIASGSCSPSHGSWSVSEHCPASLKIYIWFNLWDFARMCCCCLTLRTLRSAHLTWSRFTAPPLLLGCCDVSREQTVTLKPSLVWVLFNCLQLQPHPPVRTMTPLKFSNHSIRVFFIPGPAHPHTYFVRS